MSVFIQGESIAETQDSHPTHVSGCWKSREVGGLQAIQDPHPAQGQAWPVLRGICCLGAWAVLALLKYNGHITL